MCLMSNSVVREDNSCESGSDSGIECASFWLKTWGGWKRGILGSFTAVIFGLVILLTSIMAAVSPVGVFPHDLAAAEQPEVIEYYLPYPGLLPDSPLYKIKMVRDRISLWLTFDSEKLIWKNLQLADKRINAAVFLVNGGKAELGVVTASKAEKYLESAVVKAESMVKQGKDVKSVLNTLITATAKHAELLSSMQVKVDGANKETVRLSKELAVTLHTRSEQALRESK